MSRDTTAFSHLLDLASAELGGRAVYATDDFFAGKGNLLQPGRAAFDPDRYTERGKWMDGWESRRRRTPGHDHVIVRLGVPGALRGVDIDTDHFLGNHPPYASLDACLADPDATAEDLQRAEWVEILPQVPLAPGSRNLFPLGADGRWTHVRLHILPDGGVARLRVYGEPRPAPGQGPLDLAAATSGGRALAASDWFFSPPDNLLKPGPSERMDDGWETRRRRAPGHDWALLRLGVPGRIQRLVIDTSHFKGNHPARCAVRGVYWPGAPAGDLARWSDWHTVLPETALDPDCNHAFEPTDPGPYTHLRLDIFPCGGVARLRAHGIPGEPDGLSWLNDRSEAEAQETLHACCGSTRWARQMVAARPFASPTHLHGAAEHLWWNLSEADWLEAFEHHPRIGAAEIRDRFAAGEQAGVEGASEQVLQALAEGNRTYEERFDFLFLVCATGKSAAEMLDILRARLDNRPADELRIAAGEQAKITRIRLEKASP